MNCAGITYEPGYDRIRIAYNVSDGTKGASYSNPYTFDDIYDTDQANGWGLVSKQSTQFSLRTGIIVSGSSTYFQDDEKDIFYDVELTTYKELFDARYTNIRFGSLYGYMCFRTSRDNNAYWTRFWVKTNYDCAIINTSFDNLRVSFSGLAEYSTLLQHVTVNVLSNIDIGGDITIEHYTQYRGLCTWNRNVDAQYVNLYNCNLYHNAVGYREVTIRNINSHGQSVRIYMNSTYEATVNLIDSNVGGWSISAYSNTQHTIYNYYKKTTFNTKIENGTGGELTIEDKDGNILYSETLSSDNMSEQVIPYIYNLIEKSPEGSSYTNNETEYHPFTLRVTKPGYQDLEIPGITVTPGQPTTVYGEMVIEELKLADITFSHPSAPGKTDGSISITADGGTQPYEYSIDDGESWQAGSSFSNLPAGTYPVKIKDADETELTPGTIDLIAPEWYDKSVLAEISNTDELVAVMQDVVELSAFLETDELTARI